MKFPLLNPAAVALLVLLTGCGKAQPGDNARAAAADNPTEASPPTADEQPADGEQPTPAADETAQLDNESDNGPAETAARPAAAEAVASTWVCTWCHEEYTGERQPTSFQPGKCERNPGKAHAWHKK